MIDITLLYTLGQKKNFVIKMLITIIIFYYLFRYISKHIFRNDNRSKLNTKILTFRLYNFLLII